MSTPSLSNVIPHPALVYHEVAGLAERLHATAIIRRTPRGLQLRLALLPPPAPLQRIPLERIPLQPNDEEHNDVPDRCAGPHVAGDAARPYPRRGGGAERADGGGLAR